MLVAAQSDFAKNKWKGAVFVGSVPLLGVYVPWFCAFPLGARGILAKMEEARSARCLVRDLAHPEKSKMNR